MKIILFSISLAYNNMFVIKVEHFEANNSNYQKKKK